MLELTGMMAIAGVLTGSVLLALFVGEALITWTVRAMHAGVRRADETAAKLSGQPQLNAKLIVSQRQPLQRV